MDIKDHKVYKDYLKMRDQEMNFKLDSLPLCASENVISPFCLLPLNDISHERYLLGGTSNFNQSGNFVGSDILYNIYDLINKQAGFLFNCKYADARTLSGLNCITTVLMAITQIGDKIIISSVESGGHSSMKTIANRLGLNVIEAPYDYIEYDYDYSKINDIVKSQKVKIILLSPSNIIYEPQLNKLDTSNVLLLYDASQTLGLIASKVLSNPLRYSDNIICLGSTHKTIPGPTSGIILTNNTEIASILDEKINPDFVSNTQLQNKLILLHSLIELEMLGNGYSKKIQYCVKYLSKLLVNSNNFTLVQKDDTFSETHQILLGIHEDVYKNIEKNSIEYNVTLNLSSKRNQLFKNNLGLRIGMQEIARYNWDKPELDKVAEVLNYLTQNTPHPHIKEILIHLASKKKIHFAINN